MLNKKQHKGINHFNTSSFKPTSLFGDPAEAYGTLEHNLDKNTPKPGSDGREEKASSNNTELDVRVRPGIAIIYQSPNSKARIIREKEVLKERLPEQEKTIQIEAASSTGAESSLDAPEPCEVVSAHKPQRIYINPDTITRVVGFQIPQVTTQEPTTDKEKILQDNSATSEPTSKQAGTGNFIFIKEKPLSYVQKVKSSLHDSEEKIQIGNTRINNQGGRGC